MASILAATLILFDESGSARHLMLERSAAMAFAPGGRVAADDLAIAASRALAHDTDEAVRHVWLTAAAPL